MGKPIKSFKYGTVETAVFENQTAKGAIKKVVLNKRDKSAEGEWKSTTSLDANDIPKAMLALSKAYEFLVMGREAEDSPEEPSADD